MSATLNLPSESMMNMVAACMFAREWDCAKLAQHSGLPRSTVYKLITGRNANPTMDTLTKLFQGLMDGLGNEKGDGAIEAMQKLMTLAAKKAKAGDQVPKLLRQRVKRLSSPR